MHVRNALACSLVLALSACQQERAATPKTSPVTRGDLTEVVSATGEVSALVTVNVGSQISGTISKLHVDFNKVVKKGEMLAEIDPRLFEAALEKAQAGLAAARADAERAKVTLADAARTEERTKKMLAKSLVSAADMDAATAAREAAQAALLAAQARVQQARADATAAETNVALCKIRSPIDGIVISRAIDIGQTVAASLQAPTLFLIANDLAHMQILAAIDEADMGKVKPGMATRFTVEAYPGEVFRGTIRDLRQAPHSIQNVVTYAAVIDAPNLEHKLRQGMTASVSIVTNERAGALRIPNTALRYRPAADLDGEKPGEKPESSKLARAALGRAEAADPSTKAASAGPRSGRTVRDAGREQPGVRKVDVYKLQNGEVVRASILVGISDGKQSEVVAGLSESDLVVVSDGAGLAKEKEAKRGLF